MSEPCRCDMEFVAVTLACATGRKSSNIVTHAEMLVERLCGRAMTVDDIAFVAMPGMFYEMHVAIDMRWRCGRCLGMGVMINGDGVPHLMTFDVGNDIAVTPPTGILDNDNMTVITMSKVGKFPVRFNSVIQAVRPAAIDLAKRVEAKQKAGSKDVYAYVGRSGMASDLDWEWVFAPKSEVSRG